MSRDLLMERKAGARMQSKLEPCQVVAARRSHARAKRCIDYCRTPDQVGQALTRHFIRSRELTLLKMRG
ncbi:MAG TPA: hypothetical protein VKE26_01475 [Xanthobacteraceae bacterium]|nr:hypothetical protein [Xanthobacteraceae bacterium]